MTSDLQLGDPPSDVFSGRTSSQIEERRLFRPRLDPGVILLREDVAFLGGQRGIRLGSVVHRQLEQPQGMARQSSLEHARAEGLGGAKPGPQIVDRQFSGRTVLDQNREAGPPR